MPLEKLSAPPIVEVVCGVLFEPLGQLDPLTLGAFRDEHLEAYPAHQFQPPIIEDGKPVQFRGSFPPIRTWFISADDAWVLQVQWDRVYLNWRARGGAYPRFSDQGERQGVLSRFLREFDEFSTYCTKTFGTSPTPRAIELSKIDHFEKGRHWRDFDDLAAMLPWLTAFAAASTTKEPSVGAQFREERGGGVLSVAVDVSGNQVKLETRLVKDIATSLRETFESANAVLNDVFDKMIPEPQQSQRFMGGAA